jgi:hypothetical protein
MVGSDELMSVDPDALARLCVEYWKLSKAYSKVSDLLPEKEGRRVTAQVKFSELQLQAISEVIGVKVISFDGEEFSPGIAASADNAEDFDDGEVLIILKTIEPAIVYSMKVLSKGRVLVGRPDEIEKDQ